MVVPTPEDLIVIAKAKALICKVYQISEIDAHRAIRKRAMDLRITRAAVAHRVINQGMGALKYVKR